jgi:hypothetical protein
VIEDIKVETLTKQKKEVVHYVITERKDEEYERWYDREKVYRTKDRSRGRDNGSIGTSYVVIEV